MKRMLLLLFVGLAYTSLSMGFDLKTAGDDLGKLLSDSGEGSIIATAEDIMHSPKVGGSCKKLGYKTGSLACAKLKLKKMGALINPINKHILSTDGVVITIVDFGAALGVSQMAKLKTMLNQNFAALKDILDVVNELNKILQ